MNYKTDILGLCEIRSPESGKLTMSGETLIYSGKRENKNQKLGVDIIKDEKLKIMATNNR